MPDAPIRVLMLEDDPAAAGLASAALAREAPPGFSVETAGTAADAVRRLASAKPDLVLLDLGLPDAAGVDAFLRVREHAFDIPIVVLAEPADQGLFTALLQEGAEDCLVKGPIAIHILARALRYALERKRAQLRVERLKEQFLHNVSHELKTPLTAIHQSVRLIIDGLTGPATPPQLKFLEIADRNVNHLRIMIDDLLDVTRAETGKLSVEPRCMVLEATLEDVLGTERLSAGAKGVELNGDIAAGLPRVLADPVRVRQVLTNLADNALKFTPKGGAITVGARALPGGSMVEAFVADTGRGMEPEAARRVFDRLYQVPGSRAGEGRKGLGLGLYICKHLVERHGGSIRVESRPGEGSVFTFTLPVFSLSRLLEPMLVRDGPAASGFAFVTAEMWPPEKPLSEQSAHAVLSEARNVLRHGIHPEDVLLPEMSPPGRDGLLFVAACLDPKSVGSMSHRLEAALGSAYIVKSHRLNPRVTHEMVALNAPREGAVDQAAELAGGLALRAIQDRVARMGG